MKLMKLFSLIMACMAMSISACANDGDDVADVNDEAATESMDERSPASVESPAADDASAIDSYNRTPASVDPVAQPPATTSATDTTSTTTDADASTTGAVGATVEPGSHSLDQIRSVQQELNQRGYNIAVDGRMGPETQRALTRFQSANNLEQTGMLNAETLSALNIESGSRVPASVPDTDTSMDSAHEVEGTDLGTEETTTDEGVIDNDAADDASPENQ